MLCPASVTFLVIIFHPKQLFLNFVFLVQGNLENIEGAITKASVGAFHSICQVTNILLACLDRTNEGRWKTVVGI